MAGIVTNRFRFNNAALFKSQFSTAGVSMYFFLGRVTPWTDDSTPPERLDNVSDVRFEPWRQIFALKKITDADVTAVIPRWDWQINTKFRYYDDQDQYLYSNTSYGFYCLTPEYNVYKCIWNNNGANTTIKPTGTSTSIIRTPDGYVWKYMYTLSSADVNNFLSITHIPVRTLTANNGTAQWLIQQNAANGAIHVIVPTNAGVGYLKQVGTVNTVVNAACFSLNTGALTIDDVYNRSSVYITGGPGAGQVRPIINYIGSSRRVVVTPDFDTPLTGGVTTYEIGPTVTITGDGTNAQAIARLNAAGAVSNVTIVRAGLGYSHATVTFSANTIYGSNAAARAIISPPGGHGADAADELGGYSMLLYGIFPGSVSNTVTTSNDFRLVGMVKSPKLTSGAVANGSIYDTTTHLNIGTLVGTFQVDEVVTGLTTSAYGTVVDFVSNNEIRMIFTEGTFLTGETVQGGTSAATAVITSIEDSPIAKNTGEIIYIENRSPVARSGVQSEEIKLICRF